MGRLRATDLRAALQFAVQARATRDLETLRAELVPQLRGLVASDSLGYNEIDLRRRTAFTISDAPVYDGVDERFLQLAHQHPMVPYQRRGDLSAYMISDFLSVREFHRLELYHDVYRPLEIEDQLAFGLPAAGIVAINLGRHRRTFSERDRQMIEAVRPHLALAYRRVREQERISLLFKALDAGLEDNGMALLQLDHRGRIAHATVLARQLLTAYFGVTRDDAVPRELRMWLTGTDRPRPPLTVDGARGRLSVRELGHELEGWRTLVLEERRPGALNQNALRSLGLTSRQAQVLGLLAGGKSNRQIAQALQIQTATVSKHLEHIYDRLGVSTRGQALARLSNL
jgi:DNA-binding CsgD family transcriptional regulator